MRAARFERPEGEGRQRRWLLRVAGNVLYDHLRRRWRTPHIGLDEEFAEAIACRESVSVRESGDPTYRVGTYDLDEDQAFARIEGALRRLPPHERELIRTWYEVGSSRGVAERCGVAPHVVKTRMFRARKRLKRMLRMEVACCWRP